MSGDPELSGHTQSMLQISQKKFGYTIACGRARWRMLVALAAVVMCELSQATESLWVENPEQVAYSVADMTPGAKALGLTNGEFAKSLNVMLSRAGLQGRRSEFRNDSDVLFLDVVVDGETYYASAGFWRMASYRLPNGDIHSEFVTVWQDYSVGAHYDDPETIRVSVERLIERFIAKYNDANSAGRPLSVAATP